MLNHGPGASASAYWGEDYGGVDMQTLAFLVALCAIVGVLAAAAYRRKHDDPLGDLRYDENGREVSDASNRTMRRRQTPPGPGGMGEF